MPIWKTSVGRALGFASLLTSSRWKLAYTFQLCNFPRHHSSSRTSTSLSAISQNDVDHMNTALNYARKGLGHTFPNPAVGCVLVRQDTNEIIGAGFHPRAGFPHAEVFALLQATGHLPDGTKAAESVLQANVRKPSVDHCTETYAKVRDLSQIYIAEGGPQSLFGSHAFDYPVVAYVTLEPCCHYGKTPPCAASLVEAKVSRVVVGFRDPNPRVDGGGVRVLEEAGVPVDMMSDAEDKEGILTHQSCANVVSNFVKRISGDAPDYSLISGAMRRALRSHVGRLKRDKAIHEVDWEGKDLGADRSDDPDWEALIHNVDLDPTWLETIDGILWQEEIVILRLGKAVKRNKAVKLLGEAIASQVSAHVAQTVGHTVLLYRSGSPPKLDLAALAASSETN